MSGLPGGGEALGLPLIFNRLILLLVDFTLWDFL